MSACKNFLKAKKGINPITIVILLATLVLMTIGIVFVWMTLMNRAGNAIFIQNVRFEESQTIIDVQNTGDGAVTLESVIVGNETFSVTVTNCKVNFIDTKIIEKGQTAEITINRGYSTRVHIKIYCTDGTSHEMDWQP